MAKSKSAQTHDICFLGVGPNSGHKVFSIVAEYDPQSTHSIITRCQLDALQAKVEFFSEPATTTFRDRHRVFYIPLGTVKLRWFRHDKPVTTKFYVVNTLAPQYSPGNVDVVLGSAGDIEWQQKENQKRDKERKTQEVEQAVRDEQAAERQQRDTERQERLQQHQQQQQQQQQSSP